MARKILHCDMDAFYASVEQLDHPEFRGKPVVVGSSPQSRGVVSACSYEARKYGIRSAMSCANAYKLCKNAIFTPPRFDRYQELSEIIFNIYKRVTPLVETLSLDEAFLDVTENSLHENLAQNVAHYLKKEVFNETGLVVSIGCAPNKFVAKIASDYKKPNGLTVVPPEKVQAFLDPLPIEKIWGVGPATAKILHQLGIKKIQHLRENSLTTLESVMGLHAKTLIELASGRDERPVDPSWDPKSRGSETTFERDITSLTQLTLTLNELVEDVFLSVVKMGRLARTVTLKIKFSNFKQITRSQTLIDPVQSVEQLTKIACNLLEKERLKDESPVRLIGISLSQFITEDEPLQLWLEPL